MFYAAVGRRLGYPLKIVKAFRHIFLRWDDPDGKHWLHPDRFNIEATGPGIHCLPDEHYKTWPHEIPPEDIEAGIFLKSLTHKDELAEFIAARASCIVKHGKLADAVKAMRKAVELAPHNRRFRRTYDNWEAHRRLRARGHLFLSNPVEMPDDKPRDPYWVQISDGQKMLVQFPRPARCLPPISLPNVGLSLVRQRLTTPDGQPVEAFVPHQSSAAPIEAFWLRLPGMMNHALVYRWFSGSEVLQQQAHAIQYPNGWPVVPDGSLGHNAGVYQKQVVGSSHLESWHESSLIAAIHEESLPKPLPPIPPMDPLALPPGPIPPQLRIGVP